MGGSICLMAYQVLVSYLKLKFYSFVNILLWERERERERETNGSYLFNSISTPYGLPNAKIWFISKYFIVTEERGGGLFV